MTTKLAYQDPATVATPLLAVFAVDIATGKDASPSPALLTTSDALANAAAPWLASGEFKATLGETLLLHAPASVKAERLLIIGLGKAAALTPHELRKGAGVAVRFARPRNLADLAIAFPEDTALADEHLDSLPCELTARALAEGAIVANFDIDFYRADRKDLTVNTTVVHRETSKKSATEMQHGFDEGLILAESQNFARTLVNEPGNILTPTELGRRTKAMCDQVGLACEVHSIDKILELKMGAFAAVTQGSSEPPALIVMRYEPSTKLPADAPVIGLVGKGITFDTGGISIKPADNMDKMKYDMAGSAAMIGAMRSIALLKPNVRVISIVCSCENMPDARAYKPGDVLTAMSGKTIEVMNTDAEGRLVLADGLHYAQQLGATHLVNAATLTGAIGVALGLLNTGLFSNDDDTTQHFLDATAISGEKYWRMPCTDDYRDQIKSEIADIRNTGNSRYGGAITAAMFLKEFVSDAPHAPGVPTPWIHLDIAGTAWVDEQKPWQSKGPSGTAVRTITEWVRSYAS
jgi:leucyl aminopeptidase